MAERNCCPTLEKAVPAMVVAPQSFGSLLNLHPHCHSLVSLGVFTRDGIFHPAPEDIDFGALEDLFRQEVFRTLLKQEKITEERIELLRSWRHSGFRVFAERRIAQGQRQELESLLQYMERAPVSLQRLTYLDNESSQNARIASRDGVFVEEEDSEFAKVRRKN